MTREEVILRFCRLQAKVCQEAIGFSYAADCICAQRANGGVEIEEDLYRNDGKALEFIEKATEKAIAAYKRKAERQKGRQP